MRLLLLIVIAACSSRREPAARDLEDALQQVFMKAFRSIGTFRGDAAISSWLHGIAVNVALTLMRTRRRRVHAMGALAEEVGNAPVASSSTPEKQMALQQSAAQLYRHLDGVSAEKRIAFLLYYVEQLDLGEVADRVGVAPPTAWARIKRTRQSLLAAMAFCCATPAV